MVSWAPPDLGCLLACASSDGHVSVLDFANNQWTETAFPAHGMGVNAVSWSPSAGLPGAIARKADASQQIQQKKFVTGGSDNDVKIWSWDQEQRTYIQMCSLPDGHSDWVRDVAWSPTLLSKTYIASASQDKSVKIWTSTNPNEVGNWVLATTLRDFGDAVLWRVSWSLSGNVLAVSGSDGKVSLWKENLKGVWEKVKEITG